MIARVLLAAILCGIAAGLAMGVIQHVRLTPFILEAETFEHVAHGHSAEPHSHGADTWSPANGFERTTYTTLTAIVAAAGFALLMAGVSLVGKIPLNKYNGWLWGLCGFAVFSFAPAIGLPPELPGMAAADLNARLFWWVSCVALTAVGLWGCYQSRGRPKLLLPSLVFLALPHVLATAPRATEHASQVPAHLATQFAMSSLAANLVLWLVIGAGLGVAFHKIEKENTL